MHQVKMCKLLWFTKSVEVVLACVLQNPLNLLSCAIVRRFGGVALVFLPWVLRLL